MQRDDDSHLTSSITDWLLLWDQEDQMYKHTFPHPVFKRVGLAVWRRFSSVSGLLAHFHGIATRLPPNRPIYTFVGRNDLPQSGERVIKYSAAVVHKEGGFSFLAQHHLNEDQICSRDENPHNRFWHLKLFSHAAV